MKPYVMEDHNYSIKPLLTGVFLVGAFMILFSVFIFITNTESNIPPFELKPPGLYYIVVFAIVAVKVSIFYYISHI